ncbi:MAG: hypothetical protein AAGC81_08520 [Pseudomonadota bacterium]
MDLTSQTSFVGQTQVLTGFDPTTDLLDLGPNSIHSQIPVDTPSGFMTVHLFSSSQSLPTEGVSPADLHPESFTPIADSHPQQILSAALSYADGSDLMRPNTVYVRSHQEGVQETVDLNPATDKVSFSTSRSPATGSSTSRWRRPRKAPASTAQ